MGSHDGVAGVPSDAALVALVANHPDVTLVSESRPPAGQKSAEKQKKK